MRQAAAMAIIGYARVSTVDQDPQLQLDSLVSMGAVKIYTDHGVSGSSTDRPQFSACLDHLRKGDTLVVWKLDRLGRDTRHVLDVISDLTEREVSFRSVTEGLHTDGPMGRAMLTIMAAFAQLERDIMLERTRAGLAAAAAKGRHGGRPLKVATAETARASELMQKGLNASEVGKILGVSRATVYRHLRISGLQDREK